MSRIDSSEDLEFQKSRACWAEGEMEKIRERNFAQEELLSIMANQLAESLDNVGPFLRGRIRASLRRFKAYRFGRRI